MKANIEIPLKEEIVIEILDLHYGKRGNIVVTALYEDIGFEFSVFYNNNYMGAKGDLSFKILNEEKQLEVPDYKILACFDTTRTGFLKCMSAKIYDEKN